MTEVIEQSNNINQRLNQDQLIFELAQFTGTEKWYRHALNQYLRQKSGRSSMNFTNLCGLKNLIGH